MKHPRDWTLENWSTHWIVFAMITRGIAWGFLGNSVALFIRGMPIAATTWICVSVVMFVLNKWSRRNGRRTVEWIKIRDDISRARGLPVYGERK